MQTLDSKLKILEKILANDDFLSIVGEEGMIHYLEEHYEEIHVVRVKLMVSLLNKLDYSISLYEGDEYEYIYLCNNIITDVLNSLRSWDYFLLEEDTHMDYMENVEYLNADSEEKKRHVWKRYIPSYCEIGDGDVENVLSVFFDENNCCDTCMYDVNILHNSYLPRLVKDQLIDVGYLDYLNTPMLYYPYNAAPCMKNNSTVYFLTGWDEYYGGKILNGVYLNWRFIFAMIYVDMCCCKYYLKPLKDYSDSKSYRYF